MENKVITHTCIPVNLAGLWLFRTPEDDVIGLNRAARLVKDGQIMLKDKRTKMQTIILDYETMWCPRVVHKTVTDLELILNIPQSLQKGNRGLFLVLGIQNNVFKFGKSQWKFNQEEQFPIDQPSMWRHIIAVIDEYFHHYHCPEEKLRNNIPKKETIFQK